MPTAKLPMYNIIIDESALSPKTIGLPDSNWGIAAEVTKATLHLESHLHHHNQSAPTTGDAIFRVMFRIAGQWQEVGRVAGWTQGTEPVCDGYVDNPITKDIDVTDKVAGTTAVIYDAEVQLPQELFMCRVHGAVVAYLEVEYVSGEFSGGELSGLLGTGGEIGTLFGILTQLFYFIVVFTLIQAVMEMAI